MANHLDQTAISLLPAISPLYPQLNAMEHWTDNKPLSASKIHLFTSLQSSIESLKGGKKLTTTTVDQHIYSDASKKYTRIWVDRRTLTFQPSIVHESSTAIKLHSVLDRASKITFWSFPQWNLDNSTAVQLLTGTILPMNRMIKSMLQQIFKVTPNIKWTFTGGCDNLADHPSRPHSSAEANFNNA